MRVKKRDSTYEDISFDKVLRRIRNLCADLSGVDADEIAVKVCSRIYDGVSTSELDELAAQMCATLVTTHPDYGQLASRLIVSNHHKNTSPSFSEAMAALYHATDVHGKPNPLIGDELWSLVQAHKEKLNSVIDYQRDYLFDYFGFKTLERSYLLKAGGKIVERPQHLWMRVALGIHGSDLKEALETYDLMSQKYFTHATPTLFNAGTRMPQLASCFAEGTEVFTTNRGVVPIQEVRLGDQVVTHKGNVKQVVQLHKNPLGDRNLYMVLMAMSPSFKVTGNHRFWSITKRQRERGHSPSWNSMEDLQPGDYIAIPKKRGGVNEDTWDILNEVQCALKRKEVQIDFKYIVDNDTIRQFSQADEIVVKRHWKIDADFAWFLGMWFGCGTIHQSSLQMVIPVSQQKNVDKCIKVARDTFGIEANLQYTTDAQSSLTLSWESRFLAIAFEALFTRGYDEDPCLHPKMFDWNTWLVYRFIGGLIAARWEQRRGQYIFHTHQKLMKEVYHLSRSVGLGGPGAGFGVAQHRTKSYSYGIWHPRSRGMEFFTADDSSVITVDDQVFVRLHEKRLMIDDFPNYVYTLGVEDDHSYNVEGFVAENCFLLGTDDSIRGMYKTIGDCSMISKYAGGIGVHISNIRARGSHIRGTNGTSSGIIPMLRVYNATARHTDQAGKRLGSIAIYLEPWHADVEAFLEIRKNHGAEEERCRDLFTAMWLNDRFMKAVEANDDWYLMCPDECPGLQDVYGAAFDKLYDEYVAAGRYRKKVKAQTIWLSILKSQIEGGTPYLCYKDAANTKSNQKNLGTIKSSNLCVAPETRILTRKGYITIRDLEDQEVEVWNGLEWSTTTVRKTNDYAELVRISFSDGNVLECTPYHKFYLQSKTDADAHIMREAQHLTVDDRLISWKLPDTEGVVENAGVSVTSVEWTGRRDNTYCFNEPKRHMGVFNGVLTGNCSEIIEHSDDKEYATCNLASISLPAFVKKGDDGKLSYDFHMLHRIAGTLTRNINKVIDRTLYPVPETELSNRRHRPIGLGVQGLADVYAILRMPFDSEEAAKLNRQIFETIYHGALTASMRIAQRREEWLSELESEKTTDQSRKETLTRMLALTPEEAALTQWRGAYSTFAGSPASQGILQFDMWNASPEGQWDWDSLKADIRRYGLRNSLLLAPMPTASTSQILGNTECFEPLTSNIFQRQTLAGEFTIINKHLVRDLLNLGLWSVDMKNRLLASGGSIQQIEEIPQDIRALYKTAWELKQKVLIDQAADRGVYVCQSQSLNLFVEDPEYSKLTNMHFYAWKKGLKTGIYYLRSRPKAKMSAFTIDPSLTKGVSATKTEKATTEQENADDEPVFACRRDDPTCTMCSS